MDYQEALKLMEETVAHRVHQLMTEENRSKAGHGEMNRRAQQVHDAFNKIRNG